MVRVVSPFMMHAVLHAAIKASAACLNKSNSVYDNESDDGVRATGGNNDPEAAKKKWRSSYHRFVNQLPACCCPRDCHLGVRESLELQALISA